MKYKRSTGRAIAAILSWLSGRNSWAWRFLSSTVLPLAVVFGVAMGCYWLYGLVMTGVPPDSREVPYKDVLQTVLTLAAVGIAVFGVGAYVVLSNNIEAKVRSRTDRSLWLARGQEVVNTGWLYWQLYRLSDGKPLPTRRSLLDQAISETRQALIWVHSHLDENELETELLSVKARNNLAYYIYELDSSIGKVDRASKLTALECIDYVGQRLFRFPELTEEVNHTIEKVAAHFGTTTLP